MTKKEFNEIKKLMKENGYSELSVVIPSTKMLIMTIPLRMARYDGVHLELAEITKTLINSIAFCIRHCNFVINHNRDSPYSKKIELEIVMNYVKSIIQGD